METEKQITTQQTDKLVSNEVKILIKRPIDEVYKWVVYEPLEIQLKGTKALPGVSSTKTLNDNKLGEVGHLRKVILNDGNTALEEHIFIDKAKDDKSNRYFAYKVRDYTLKIAQNIEYGKGEWWFTPVGNETKVRWRYSFKLNSKKTLGRLGFLGRLLFNNFFLKSKYNEYMLEALNKLKIDLEKQTLL